MTTVETAIGQRMRIIDWYLKKGVDIDAINNSGRTMLAMAIEGGQFSVATELLKRGASLDCKVFNEGDISDIVNGSILRFPDLIDSIKKFYPVFLKHHGDPFRLTQTIAGHRCAIAKNSQPHLLDPSSLDTQTWNQVAAHALRAISNGVAMEEAESFLGSTHRNTNATNQ